MTAKQEVAMLLSTMIRRVEDLNGRIVAPQEIAWFKQRLAELHYHTTRMFADP